MDKNQLTKNGVIDYLLTNVPIAEKDDKIGKVVDSIRRKKNWDTINYVYVLDDKKELVGVISIKELLRAKNSLVCKEIMTKQPAGVSASVKQEKAAVVAIRYNIKAVPVFKSWHQRVFRSCWNR